jgi:arylsulfatase A-like enzyme
MSRAARGGQEKEEEAVMVDRREFLMSAGAALVPPRPNVLFIISDQMHHAPGASTPNLDRLASGGVRFTHAVCSTPFCSPTRASFMTGVFPHSHGITYNVGDPST